MTHGSSANISGKYFNIVPYGIDDQGNIDYENIRQLALKHKPKVICAGASAYPRIIDFKKFREIADECGAYLWVDMAHIAGLVATGLHPSTLPYAHVVTSTTHKTLRGPRGGLILCSEEFAKEHGLNKAIFPGIQGGPLENIIAGKAVCFKEALDPSFKDYQQKVIDNCKVLADKLKEKGFKLITNGTDNHLMLIDLTNFGINGKYYQNACDQCRITLNKNSIPNEPLSSFITSGVRIGTAAITTRGFKKEDMQVIADCLYLIATEYPNCQGDVIQRVENLVKKYPIYQ